MATISDSMDDVTGIGTQQLLTYTMTQVHNCIERQIELAKHLLHGRCRFDLRQKSQRSNGKGGEGNARREAHMSNKVDLWTTPMLLQFGLLTENGKISTKPKQGQLQDTGIPDH